MTLISFDGQEVLELRNAQASVIVAPQFGARLLRWTVHGEPVIFWPEHADWSNPARVRGGNPVLFPFVGRHFVDGELGAWRDAQGQVYALPTHGFARDLPFSYEIDEDQLAIRMKLSDSAATRAVYPFEFDFEVIYRLRGCALEVEFVTHNRGTVPMPYYAGHHFYFALPAALRADTTLTLPANCSQSQGPGGAPLPGVPGHLQYRIDDPQILDRFHVLEQSGPTILYTPALARSITLDLDWGTTAPGRSPWYAVTTWTERPDSDFFCVEPWLGLPDAIHHQEGLRWIAPGVTERAALRILVEATPGHHTTPCTEADA